MQKYMKGGMVDEEAAVVSNYSVNYSESAASKSIDWRKLFPQ